MYKPSNTWINDALRFCAECWLSVVHIAELDEADMTDNLKELVDILTVIRREMIIKITKYCPDMNPKLTCIATKHIPAIVHYGIEVMNSSPEGMGDIMLSARRAKALAFQEFSGIQMKESGCPECLNELSPVFLGDSIPQLEQSTSQSPLQSDEDYRIASLVMTEPLDQEETDPSFDYQL